MAADQNAGESSPPAGQGEDAPAPDEDASGDVDYDDDALANALADENLRLTLTGSLKLANIFPPAVATTLPVDENLERFPAPSGVAFDLPAPPQRTALGNADLIENLDVEAKDTTTRLGVMKQLEEQMRLRAEQSSDYERWERKMLDIGTPDALRYVEQTRGDFEGLVVPPGLAPSSAEEVAANEAAEAQLAVAESELPIAAPTRESEPASGAGAGPDPDSPSLRSRRAARRGDPIGERIELPAAWASIVPSAVDFAGVPEPAVPEPAVPRRVVPEPVVPEPVALDAVAQEAVAQEAVEHKPALPEPAPEPELPAPDRQAPERQEPPIESTATPVADLSSFPPPTTAPFSFDSLISGELAIAAGALPSEGAAVFTPFPHYGYPDPPRGSRDDETADDLAGDDLIDDDLDDLDDLDDRGDLGDYPESTPAASWLAASSAASSAARDTDGNVRRGILSLETAGAEPTILDARIARAARLFWLWFAANSSIVSLAVGGVVFSLGVSLRQAIVATLIGVAISFLPLGLGTLASKWSGQPTMVVSRAAFGLFGNIAPAVLAVITRVFWGAVLVWLLGSSTARLLVVGGAVSAHQELGTSVAVIVVGLLLAVVVAFFGAALIARVQLVLSIVAGVLIIGLIAATWRSIDISAALSVPDGPWILVLTGTVLVFSFVGLAWANSAGDLARYQRPSSSGGASMLLASFGSTLPAFILVGYGALLAASSPRIARGLLVSPIDTIAGLLPSWFPVPLLVVAGLSLLSGLVITIYSGGFALLAVGVRVPRVTSTAIVAALVLIVGIVIATAAGGILPIVRDLATTLAVPVAAWAGIFAADMIIRRRRFDTLSLLRPGGIYPKANRVNLGGFIVATILGVGLSTATVGWLSWEGFVFRLLGVPLTDDLAASDLGVLVALAIGLITPFAFGIPTVRRQEEAQPVA